MEMTITSNRFLYCGLSSSLTMVQSNQKDAGKCADFRVFHFCLTFFGSAEIKGGNGEWLLFPAIINIINLSQLPTFDYQSLSPLIIELDDGNIYRKPHIFIYNYIIL